MSVKQKERIDPEVQSFRTTITEPHINVAIDEYMIGNGIDKRKEFINECIRYTLSEEGYLSIK